MRWGYVEMVRERFSMKEHIPCLRFLYHVELVIESAIVPTGYTVVRLGPPRIIRSGDVKTLPPEQCEIGGDSLCLLGQQLLRCFSVFTTRDRAGDICVGHAYINPTDQQDAKSFIDFYKAVVEAVVDSSFANMRDVGRVNIRVDAGYGGFRSVVKSYTTGDIHGYHFISDPLSVVDEAENREKRLNTTGHYPLQSF
ncbi:hypothetical protein HRbin01_01632 [archaeon HR01]|nr:hypothetical protein HRbin01_01632 [archaeon HR01]